MRATVIALASLIATSSACHAQSAVETAAYLIDGIVVGHGTTRVNLTEDYGEWTYEASDYVKRMKIKKIDACNYEFNTTQIGKPPYSGRHNSTVTADFSRADYKKAYTRWESVNLFMISGVKHCNKGPDSGVFATKIPVGSCGDELISIVPVFGVPLPPVFELMAGFCKPRLF